MWMNSFNRRRNPNLTTPKWVEGKVTLENAGRRHNTVLYQLSYLPRTLGEWDSNPRPRASKAKELLASLPE